MPAWDCLIFDLDGTLTDSREAIVGAATDAVTHLGLPAPAPGAILELVGLPLDVLVGRLLPPRAQRRLPDAVDHYREVYVERCRATTTLFPGVSRLLDEVGDVPLAVATGKSLAGAERVLRELGLRDRFVAVVGNDSVRNPKPHPDMVHLVWDAVPAAPGRTLVIGDTTYDIDMGRAAGAKTCAVTWGNHSPERLRAVSPDHLAEDVATLGRLCSGG